MKKEKKFYVTPELDIDKFTICCTFAVSDPKGLEGNDNEYIGGSGGDDWEF